MFVTATVALGVLLVPTVRLRRTNRLRSRLDEQAFYASVHSELVAGASLRQAIDRAASTQSCEELDSVRKAARPGSPSGDMAVALRVLPDGGDNAAVAFQVALRSGGAAAAVFLRLADRAAASADLARQQRALTAQARLSAAVVASLPVVWLLFGGLGRLHTTVSLGGAWIVAAGLGMQVLGGLMTWRMATS